MNSADFDAWADAWIEGVQDPLRLDEGHPCWWTIERFNSPATPLDDIWAAILHILGKEPLPEVRAILAGGPLEDLIHEHGEEFIDRIESQAQGDPAFRTLLANVFESGSPDVWARVEHARSQT